MIKTSVKGKKWILLLTGMTAITLFTTQPGCSAAAFGKPSLALEVQSAVSSGNVNVYLSDGIAMLTGRVESSYDALAAERAAARYEGVEQVINNIYVIRSR